LIKRLAAGALATACVIAAGCDDGTGFDFPTVLVEDTVVVAAPLPQNDDLPTALDIMSNDDSGDVGGGRFPEWSRDALRWDFLVRVEDGELVLLPDSAAGVGGTGAALTPPIEDATFETLLEVPGPSSFVRSDGVAMVVGAVYAARSRVVNPATGCFQYAKLEPLQVDVEEGLLEVQIVTNQRCGDGRLVPPE
jgi:hypothetical protein